jgi:AhpD family alkylhydroperoxidase
LTHGPFFWLRVLLTLPNGNRGFAFMSVPEMETSSVYSPAVEKLVAIAAAVACNCEPCFKHHFREAINLGVSRGDVALAVATARKVKEQIAAQMLQTAGEQLAAAREVGPQPGSCCCAELPPRTPKRS